MTDTGFIESDERPTEADRVISPATSADVRAMLRQVVGDLIMTGTACFI